ncbi:hypothetical protein [Streptomyces agglomeratus]|uniref:hypothetical protein n=1 Tax=Streptomyces agglomeratus TaxID=285458 RepID=UPI001428A2AB|nr:hypothetical protein [Streptomyces agglomeratus]
MASSTTSRRLGGHQLPVTDLVLHELWPLVGTRRARAAHTAFTMAAPSAPKHRPRA